MPRRFHFLTIVLSLTATLTVFSQCARVNVPFILPPVIDLKVWFNDTVDPQWFYFIAFQFGTTPSDGPMPEVSGSSRARDWTHYILYTGHSSLTNVPKFFFRKIDPPNNEEQILFAPTEELFRKAFYLDARVYSEPVDGQSRVNNGLHFIFDRDKFLEGNTRFDMTLLTATRGVDQVSNPPSPPEPGQVIDAYDTVYISINTLAVGTVLGEQFAPQERKDDVPAGFADADIVGWELRVR
ncbi:MAG: hypothetical protein V2G42_03540 [bacterium JZ-2024 1]